MIRRQGVVNSTTQRPEEADREGAELALMQAEQLAEQVANMKLVGVIRQQAVIGSTMQRPAEAHRGGAEWAMMQADQVADQAADTPLRREAVHMHLPQATHA